VTRGASSVSCKTGNHRISTAGPSFRLSPSVMSGAFASSCPAGIALAGISRLIDSASGSARFD